MNLCRLDQDVRPRGSLILPGDGTNLFRRVWSYLTDLKPKELLLRRLGSSVGQRRIDSNGSDSAGSRDSRERPALTPMITYRFRYHDTLNNCEAHCLVEALSLDHAYIRFCIAARNHVLKEVYEDRQNTYTISQ